MGWQVIRFGETASQWGIVYGDAVAPLTDSYATLGDFLTNGGAEQARASVPNAATIPLASIQPLSPASAPCRLVCQGTNYQAHRNETQVNPGFNLLFVKADSSLTAPNGPVTRPRGVKLLDYELELGLVIGRAITGPIQTQAERLDEVVAGLVMANDVSARDVQIPETQWFRGKSFRTFCPVGPYFYLFGDGDVKRLGELRLQLWVNGQLRQDAYADQMIYAPAPTLNFVSQVMNLAPGDLLLTGTPGGVALRPPTGLARRIGEMLPPAQRMRTFVSGQIKRPEYLHDGDVVTSTIATADGAIDLGRQEWVIAPTASA